MRPPQPRLRWVTLATLALAAAPAAAQTSADSAAIEYFTPAGAWGGMSVYGDARLRREIVRDRPGAASDLTLTRFTVRVGVVREPYRSPLRAEFGLRITPTGPQEVSSNTLLIGEPQIVAWEGVINERLIPVEVDRLGVRIAPGSGALALSLGRQRAALRLTEMMWDDDRRPIGAFATARRDFSASASGRFGAGWLSLARGLREMPGHRLGAVQISALFREDRAAGGDATVSWLRFDGTPRFTRQNEAGSGGRGYAARFQVLDLQLGARAAPGGVPLSVRLDLARNVVRSRDRDGARMRLALGGAGLPAGLEVGWVFQRVQRELIPGEFNSDDWWFHTRMRGNQAWLRVGLGTRLDARVAAFHERRDDVARPTRRLTVELAARRPAL